MKKHWLGETLRESSSSEVQIFFGSFAKIGSWLARNSTSARIEPDGNNITWRPSKLSALVFEELFNLQVTKFT